MDLCENQIYAHLEFSCFQHIDYSISAITLQGNPVIPAKLVGYVFDVNFSISLSFKSLSRLQRFSTINTPSSVQY